MPRFKVLEVDTAAELEVKLNSQENSNYRLLQVVHAPISSFPLKLIAVLVLMG
jgi:hypothetical protein